MTTKLVKALKTIKSGLMHQRRVGAETLGAWRSAAVDAEGSIEEALTLCNNEHEWKYKVETTYGVDGLYTPDCRKIKPIEQCADRHKEPDWYVSSYYKIVLPDDKACIVHVIEQRVDGKVGERKSAYTGRIDTSPNPSDFRTYEIWLLYLQVWDLTEQRRA